MNNIDFIDNVKNIYAKRFVIVLVAIFLALVFLIYLVTEVVKEVVKCVHRVYVEHFNQILDIIREMIKSKW